MPRAKYAYLLKDERVGLWYRNLARGSKVMVDVCLRRLGTFYLCLRNLMIG